MLESGNGKKSGVFNYHLVILNHIEETYNKFGILNSDDIIKIFGKLAEHSNGRISVDSDLVLACPPAIMVNLGKSTEYGKSVIDMLKNYFTKIDFVTLPELKSGDTNSVLMCAREVDGAPVAELAFSEKMRAHQLIPELSSYKQKFSAGTYGAVVLRPFAIQIMTGV